ncbi:MAG: serine/threonine-protein kinase [Kiritimatiellia bacterium]
MHSISPKAGQSGAGRTARIQVTPAADGARRQPAPAELLDKTILLHAEDAEIEHNSGSTNENPQDNLFQYYTILGKIGDGGMGVVYLAKDKRLGRFVSIKRLNAQGQRVPSLRQRFLQEARAVAALTHIHIVHIYGLGEDQDGPYIVMEYIAGPDDQPVDRNAPLDRPTPPLTLDQLVARNGQLAVTEAVQLLIKIGRAVAYAHSCGVIHRDLKPGNVLLDKSSEPKIVDFGLARLMRSEENKLTVPGEKLLSLGYGAPEQEQDASLSDERADVYGLGALLYFALTGQNPRYFREQDIPVPFRDVLVKALATDREQRFPSATAFTEALQSTQDKTHVAAPTVKTTWHCKWCDTVNPLSLRYCAECGWDGGEACPECGVETFVGIQFCGTCGADARSYESLQHVLQRMRAAMEQRLFERVLSLGGRAHGFEAAGPSGRRMQKEAQDLREQAERNLARRDELREQIPLEIRAENFERALAFIREIRLLDENQHLFEDEERRIPELTMARDVARADRAIRARDWETAARIADEIRRRSPPDNPDGLRLSRRISLHHKLLQTGWISIVATALALLYLLSLPPVARNTKGPLASMLRSFYQPAWNCYDSGLFSGLLGHYTALWGCTNLSACFSANPSPPVDPTPPPPLAEPDLQKRQFAFNQQIQLLNLEQQRDTDKWPQDFLRDLDTLAKQCQTDGFYDGWKATTDTIKLFKESNRINDAPAGYDLPALSELIARYRQIVSVQHLDRCRRLVSTTRKYVKDLTELQKTKTREGNMTAAAAINDEIRRVQTPEMREAETELAATTAGSANPTPGTAQPLDPEKIAALVAPLRTLYQVQLDTVSSNYDARVKLWPAKYKSAIESLMDSFQKQGSYDDWQKAKNELDRFDADGQIQAKDLVQQPEKLKKEQQDHLALLVEYRKARARSVLEAANVLIGKYEELRKKHTMEKKMEVAEAVTDLIKQVRNSREYVAAQQELAPSPSATTNTNKPPATAASPGGK